jgi:hypothetical protein
MKPDAGAIWKKIRTEKAWNTSMLSWMLFACVSLLKISVKELFCTLGIAL